MDRGPTVTTPCNRNYLLRYPACKHSHTKHQAFDTRTWERHKCSVHITGFATTRFTAFQETPSPGSAFHPQWTVHTSSGVYLSPAQESFSGPQVPDPQR